MIRLRLMEDSDLDWAFQLTWRPEVHPWLFWDELKPLRASFGATILETGPETISRAFVFMEGQERAGYATLNHMHPVHRTGSVGYLVASKPGAGRGGLSALFDCGFSTFNLNRIESRVFAENRPILAVLKRLGVSLDGVLRQASYRAGSYHDVIIVSILRREWEARNAR